MGNRTQQGAAAQRGVASQATRAERSVGGARPPARRAPQDVHWHERTALERLSHILPGFRGYHAREHRRETDQLFRSFGLHRLERVRTRVEQARQKLRGRERTPYRGIAKRLARLCEDLEVRALQPFLERESRQAAALDALYTEEEDVVRGVVELSVAIDERGTRPEDLLREIERVERALARRSELIASLLD
jgi:hypothetical protein